LGTSAHLTFVSFETLKNITSIDPDKICGKISQCLQTRNIVQPALHLDKINKSCELVDIEKELTLFPLSSDIVVSWKKHSPKCYHLVSYRIASDTRSPADCQRVCVKEKRCRTFHQYRDLYCYLSNNRFYEIGIIGCTRKIIIYEKGM
jgi:hypothetical protein